ncbi:hypothetical protein [Kitasatospora sp. NPDC004289]
MTNQVNPPGSSAEDLRLRHYPDLVQSGGLRPAILGVAGAHRTEPGVLAEGPMPSASQWSAAEFASPRGAMRVNLGHGVRRFAVTLDGHGHVWASGSTSDLSEVVEVLVSWQHGVKLRELAARFPFMEFDRLSQAYEDGNVVEVQWDIVIGDDDFLLYRELLLALRENAGLREFFPYFSHWTLRLSKDQADAGAAEILIQRAAEGEGFVLWSSSALDHKREFHGVGEVLRAAASLADEL